VLRAFGGLNAQIYNTMQGPNEFVVTGNFKDWDRWADLHRIHAPTLLPVGRFDEISVAAIERTATLLPHARVVVCEKGSHLTMYDDQAAYFDARIPFVIEAHSAGA
jgi:proline iminopeptidase